MKNRRKRICLVTFFVSLAPACGPGPQETAGTIDSIEWSPTSLYLADDASKTSPLVGEDLLPLDQLDTPEGFFQQSVEHGFHGGKGDSTLDGQARLLIEQNSDLLGLNTDTTALQLTQERETLTGIYLEYEQVLNDIPILGSQIGMAITPQGEVSSLVRTTVHVPTSKTGEIPSQPGIEETEAIRVAWDDLKVTGELLEEPSVSSAYFPEDEGLTLVYVVRVAVDEPFGYWEYKIDALTGRVIEKQDTRIHEGKRAYPGGTNPSGTVVALDDALTSFRTAKTRPTRDPAVKTVNALAQVFDPQPIATLNDASLRDDHPASSFAGAYVTVALNGVTDTNGVYSLTGPSVRIEDFERGEGDRWLPPSTSNGNWTAQRGQNAFNDVMTYFFLQSSIEYLRSLGYNGTRELFPAGIVADSDGLRGADNSHYVPRSDRLAFGHGCVDDNEDADVILHEFGHAITHHVNRGWRGGDSGAIGEGFGDYWAYSYRLRTGAQEPEPGKVFVWDGIAQCWGGRRVDRLNARYDPDVTYRDHQGMGGFVSDELWSTPLVQAHLELVASGESHESVDRVILEGMSVVGSNFTMRTLARATVDRAKVLYPGRSHATVFEKHFKRHNILE